MAAKDGDYLHQDVTGAIIGAAIDVYHELGSGFLEKVYENALALELSGRGLDVMPQAEMSVRYKDQTVGTYYADLLVNRVVVCEIEATESINSSHQAQLLNYLKATGIKVGLLLNFGPRRVDIKRLVL